ncbi:mandelate racemase/muconate lactonizing enzyme family protein [Variovorax terrae]|uniref:Mandelate racemase/muconate lactonizing enzyme family protein n=1 Tax=Variovorax terrae TaxID=2923278 RepID=A0A9X1W5L1_9BURK|nr:mandelate racemase/muconate lactonizing enzyme family protein [Variovorax terrae]MCJ0766178.1 mandelate racemase/muconate lactonizing enzyme family protein [Variovorax terrae]
MKIVRVEDLHADGGLKPFSFVKITTDEGLIGWSEFSEFLGSQGLSAVIRRLSEHVIGLDPLQSSRLSTMLRARVRVADGGLNAQAVAAIENACLDIEAKALGVPVHRLFGGAVRDRLRVYWSHCGSYRARGAKTLDRPPVRSLDDLVELGREVKERGFSALKTNLLMFEGDKPHAFLRESPGFGYGKGHPELNLEPEVLDAMVAQMHAFRQGAGPSIGIALDVNFNYRPAGLKRLAKALEPLGLAWLEMDVYDARTLADLRRSTSTPIGSMEAVYGRRHAIPFFVERAVDYAIIDAMWNGFSEAVKMATLAEGFEVNINSHAFSSPLGLLIGAQLCALSPNFNYVEMDVDQPPVSAELFHSQLKVENGELILPERPGWGLEVNEEALARHAPDARAAERWLRKRSIDDPS